MKSRVRELRHKHGISQTELANSIGTTKRTIYDIETGKTDTRISIAGKLAAYFGCGIDDLFVFEDGRHTVSNKAMWYVHVVRHTAEVMGKPIWETAKLLEHSGLAERVISGYDVWHTQGYEYMAEVISEKLGDSMESDKKA